MNLLLCDGEAINYGVIFSAAEQLEYQTKLEQEIPWAHDEVVMFGKRITLSRKMAWVADREQSYLYSGSEKLPLPWTPLLCALKHRCEAISGEVFNSCLLNFYHDGSEGMGWHADDEPAIVRDSAIASLSFGAARKFSFKHRISKESISTILESGSLLVMKGATQRCWKHALPKSKKVLGPRINLTFRLRC